MSKTNTPVSPFSSGPGGSRFELLVASFYLASLLKGEIPFGYVDGGRIFSVELQQKNKDNPVDDVIIQSEKGIFSIQVKHSVRFTNNVSKTKGKRPEFYDAISQCWSLYRSKKFNPITDCFGIAFNEAKVSIAARTNINDVINWAKREKSVKSYLRQLNKFTEKKKYFNIFQSLLSDISKSAVDDTTVWDFIRHLAILPFNFDQTSGHSGYDLLNKLRDVAQSQTADNAEALLSIIYYQATDYAITGGEIDTYDLEKHLPMGIYAPINSTMPYVLQKKLELQLNQKIDREIRTKKYIPVVFTESPVANDELRIFSDPVLFIQKIVEDLQKIDIYQYNELATKLDFPLINIGLPNSFQPPVTISETISESENIKNHISKIVEMLQDTDPFGKSISKYLMASNRPLFEELKLSLHGCNSSLQYNLNKINHRLNLIKSRLLIIKGKAASGKTNFICNFADRTLRGRRQTAFYVTGSDISVEAKTTTLKRFIIDRFNEEYDGKISRLIPDIERISNKNKKPLLIIIDGLNEHSDLTQFAGQLEQIIEEFVSTIHVKFILTCRSEYFDERFSNLMTSSFAGTISIIQDFSDNHTPIHKRYMIGSYFTHFNIRCHPNRNVIDIFVKNPFILRLFCEVYESENCEKPTIVGPINTLHLDVLFNKYNIKFRDALEKKYPDANIKRNYSRLLYELASYMIDNKAFLNVPLDSIPSEYHNIITIMANEGIILRKDLPEEKSITEDTERLNFTYDEFRDYVLADYLVKSLSRKDFMKCKQIIHQILSQDSPVFEGLSKYIFMISRRCANQEVIDFLKTLDIYDEIFLRAIFTIDNSLIFPEDVVTINELLQTDSKTAERILSGLTNRRDKTDFPTINIWLFFDFVTHLNKSDYLRLISPIFSYSYGWFDRTCTDIKKIVDGCDLETIELDSNSSLIEMLICISPIPSTSSRRDIHIQPFELLLEIGDKYPSKTVSLITKYLEDPESQIAQTLWAEITCSQSDFFINDKMGIAKKLRSVDSRGLNHGIRTSINRFLPEKDLDD